MRNITVRASLMAVLFLFTVMIVLGAGIGVFALYDANQQTFAVQDDNADVDRVSDLHIHMQSLQSSLNQIALQKQLQQTVPASLVAASAQSQQLLNELTDWSKVIANKPVQMKQVIESAQNYLTNMTDEVNLTESNQPVPETLSQERASLRSGFEQNLTAYSDYMQAKTKSIKEGRELAFHIVLILVSLGMIGSILIVLGVHYFLKQVVIKPLNEAVTLLNKVAAGDLTNEVVIKRHNEIGRLFSAMQRMQQSLYAMVSRVRGTSESIHSSADEIAVGNADLSHRTEVESSSLQDTAASIDELTGAVSQNADNAQKANDVVQSTVDQAVKGGQVVKQVVDRMNSINESARKIADIVGMIDGIAFQTNILALNASVEAARAGEQGRGFAVVANEVHSLAQRSAAAAKEVKTLITASLSEVETGNQLVHHAGLAMNDVVQSICRVRDLVGEISLASSEQSIGISQVNSAISKIDDITHQNVALVEQSAKAAQSLKDQAETLMHAVSEFKVSQQLSMTEDKTDLINVSDMPVQQLAYQQGNQVMLADAGAQTVAIHR